LVQTVIPVYHDRIKKQISHTDECWDYDYRHGEGNMTEVKYWALPLGMALLGTRLPYFSAVYVYVR